MAADPATRQRQRIEGARALAARLPDLLVAARRVAASVILGIHGRRRPGPGETFWQFRHYAMGEPARRIDWRRSARDHHLYVREREWEAAQTVWLWCDLSPSMRFRSQLAEVEKIDRALVLTLATAEMLGRGGERVGMPGVLPPRIGRDAAERIAEALARLEQQEALEAEWPPVNRIGRFGDLVVISDCLAETEVMRERILALAGRSARLHLLQVLDPAEETFPYDGRLEFRDPETGGLWLAERAGGLRQGYRARLEAHRDAIALMARRASFSFATHHTDRPASEGLLFLYSRLAAPRDAPSSLRASA
jgi:uncharacterized protein (DUF58 family)